MLCARCDRPILPGQPYSTHTVHGASAAGALVRLHVLCPGVAARR